MVDRRIMTMQDVECVLSGTELDKLASDLRGNLIRLDDPDYNTVRKVWNGLIDKRPALIARCTDADDVNHIREICSGTRSPGFDSRRWSQRCRAGGVREGSDDRSLADEENPN